MSAITSRITCSTSCYAYMSGAKIVHARPTLYGDGIRNLIRIKNVPPCPEERGLRYPYTPGGTIMPATNSVTNRWHSLKKA